MTESLEDVISRLRAAVSAEDEIEIFNKSEVAAIRRMIKTMDMLESWGKLGRMMLWILMTCAGALIAWDKILQVMVPK